MSTPLSPSAPSSGWSTVRLVAGRELTTRMRSRAYIVTTLVMLVAVIVGGVVLHLAQGSSSAKVVGLTPQTASLTQPLQSAAKAAGDDIEVTQVPDDAAAKSGVEDGSLDAALTGDPESFTVVVKKELDTTSAAVLTSLRQQTALAHAIMQLGGDPRKVSQQLSDVQLDVAPLEPQLERDSAQIVAGYVAGILLFITLQTCAQLVAQGVVEEKSSRVVELLLATVRPWQLMAGKVLGIGVVGLVQVGVVVLGGAGTAAALGLVKASDIDLGATALWALVWFVVGFLMYSLALAALAALVSRQEDIGSVTAPVVMLMIVPYIIGISIAPWNPDSPIVVWLSYLPFCAPLVMPIRIALGTVETWQAVVSVLISLALLPALVWLAGRIYSNAVLRTGARVKLRDALRAA
ncbi:ABC transporter permease [Luteimicrobium album]|uniref:ABC transporter permease n=1 Tax=Luteimicrobium album TaxID=1054550 RepID=A0ABQ6I252_9MICO|nr:ABC transporter permease [Luteimicrobium album]GMA24853.1 ABC transporter permease [Luteimicrobium album]